MNSKRKATVVGLAAGLIGGGAAGMAFGVPALTSAAGGDPAAVVQQEDSPDDTTNDTTDTTTTDSTTTDSTTTDSTTTDSTTDTTEVQADTDGSRHGERLRETLQELVDDGTLTSEQADTVAEFLAAQRPDFPDDGGHFGRGHRGHDGIGLDHGDLAELFGLEPAELRELIRDGQSLAEIAAAQGVDVQAVIDTLVAAADERLDAAVADGRLTQEEADAKLADVTERVTERIDESRAADD